MELSKKIKDITGQRFGMLLVTEFSHLSKHRDAFWKTLCDCGKMSIKNGSSLRKGTTTSCGCSRRNDLVGKKFGTLLVLGYSHSNSSYNAVWDVMCDCGVTKKVLGTELIKGTTISCGCYRKKLSTTHGKSGTKIYRIWKGIKARCYNPNNDAYVNYGGRGIKLCDEWLNEENGFINFYNYLGDPPEGLSLDRKDPDGDYCPENCRWATAIEQANNKRSNKHTKQLKELKEGVLAISDFSTLTEDAWKVITNLCNEINL